MPETTMSDLYVDVLLKVSGRNLEAKKTNRVISDYNRKLEELHVEEQRNDGKLFKFWVSNVDEFRHELISKDVLICSRKVKFEVRDPHPHTHNNYLHRIQVRIHKALMELKVEAYQTKTEKIVIETIDTHIEGNFREGRWPSDPFDRAMI